jgi:hypothetical protein
MFEYDQGGTVAQLGQPSEAKASLSLDVSSLIRKPDVSSYLQGGSTVTVTFSLIFLI